MNWKQMKRFENLHHLAFRKETAFNSVFDWLGKGKGK